MSLFAHRAVFGTFLVLGLVDLAWLDANAARLGGENAQSGPTVRLAMSVNAEPPPPIATAAPPVVTAPEAPPSPREEASPRAPSTFVVLFDRSLSVINDDQATVLFAVAEALKNDASAIVRIGGHADRMAWKGNRSSNLALSEDRAAAVARALGALGVKAERIRRTAFGDKRPVDDRATEDAYQRNRRVELRIVHPGDR